MHSAEVSADKQQWVKKFVETPSQLRHKVVQLGKDSGFGVYCNSGEKPLDLPAGSDSWKRRML